jgi:hypothetical protein
MLRYWLSGVAPRSQPRRVDSKQRDSFDRSDSGWPRVLGRFAAEAWRRAEAGELADEELYPSDATWSGIYDRMHTHTPEEVERRLTLAFEHGDGFAE